MVRSAVWQIGFLPPPSAPSFPESPVEEPPVVEPPVVEPPEVEGAASAGGAEDGAAPVEDAAEEDGATDEAGAVAEVGAEPAASLCPEPHAVAVAARAVTTAVARRRRAERAAGRERIVISSGCRLRCFLLTPTTLGRHRS
jgi:hypothetical protein